MKHAHPGSGSEIVSGAGYTEPTEPTDLSPNDTVDVSKNPRK